MISVSCCIDLKADDLVPFSDYLCCLSGSEIGKCQANNILTIFSIKCQPMDVDISIWVFIEPDSNLMYYCRWVEINRLFYRFLRIFCLKHWCVRAISKAELDS